MVKPLRIGIIGLGWVARDYMSPAIAEAGDRVRLTAVVSLDDEGFVGLDPDVQRFHRLDDLSAELVDAVYIATPNHLHRPQAIACLDRGIHVLCEKPLALSYAEACEMRDAALRNGRLLVTAFDQRHHPAHRAMRERIRAGAIGTPTQARIDYACWLPAGWSADNWRIDRTRAGGGAVIDLAPHGLDLLEWLLEDEVRDVHCFLQRAVHDYPVDDGGVLSVRFRGGTLAALTVGYNRPETLPRRRLEVTGTAGTLLAENTMGQDAGGRLRFIDATDGRVDTISFSPTEGPFRHQLLDFVDRIHSAPGDCRDLDVALRHVELLERALTRATDPTHSLWP
ncbi:Gfo/Idh/MocA family protein [Lewinella sp. JB7]|uniref:Gfo/Idh/MocA family protein n=1 Tax=Lewinella sp. JB7 TaxID=2962887 RepID=UPI0020C9C064|nr:Gfo/Idh/MocA family oxidoreductase [Lewinella sp. JB7]MCP9236938.1 Gfo/Idh/MocA family oxidoreductase [Lewinella sp. JB7]